MGKANSYAVQHQSVLYTIRGNFYSQYVPIVYLLLGINRSCFPLLAMNPT